MTGESIRWETPTCIICNATTYNFFLEVPNRFNPEEKFQLVQCDKCRLVFLSPRPTEESMKSYYEDEDYQPHQKEGKSLTEKLYQRVRNWNVKYKKGIIEKFTQNGCILDYGCGTGEFLLEMQKSGWESFGFEPAEKAAKIAESYGLKMLKELTNIDGKVNVITMWHVLEHVHHPNELLERFKKILIPGGYLIIAVPNRLSFDANVYQSYWAPYDVPRHLYHFVPRDMHRLLEKHSFLIEDHKMLYFDPWYNTLLSTSLETNDRSVIFKIIGLFKSILVAKYAMFSGMFNKQKASSIVYIAKLTNLEK